MATTMTFLCHKDTIAEPGSLGIDQHGLFIVRQNGRCFAYRNRCPHLGVELNWTENQFLDRDDSLIQCATHGALFVVETGECVAGPCMGDCLEAVPIIEHNGELHLAEDQT